MSIYIYLVVGSVPYEVQDVIGAFTSNNKAEDFRDECYEYDETRPAPLSIDMPEDVWIKGVAEAQAWDMAHPAKGQYDFYTVSKMELL